MSKTFRVVGVARPARRQRFQAGRRREGVGGAADRASQGTRTALQMGDDGGMLTAWWVAIVGATGYLAVTVYLLFGLGMLCPANAVTTGSFHNLAIILGYATVFAGIWFAAPANPLLKILYEVAALFLFMLEMGVVVVFGALVHLLDGSARAFGC